MFSLGILRGANASGGPSLFDAKTGAENSVPVVMAAVSWRMLDTVALEMVVSGCRGGGGGGAGCWVDMGIVRGRE